MHPADIKASLKKVGYSMVKVAEELKISDTAVYLVIHGRSRSARIEKKISRITNIPLYELWPDTYTRVAA